MNYPNKHIYEKTMAEVNRSLSLSLPLSLSVIKAANNLILNLTYECIICSTLTSVDSVSRILTKISSNY